MCVCVDCICVCMYVLSVCVCVYVCVECVSVFVRTYMHQWCLCNCLCMFVFVHMCLQLEQTGSLTPLSPVVSCNLPLPLPPGHNTSEEAGPWGHHSADQRNSADFSGGLYVHTVHMYILCMYILGCTPSLVSDVSTMMVHTVFK